MKEPALFFWLFTLVLSGISYADSGSREYHQFLKDEFVHDSEFDVQSVSLHGLDDALNTRKEIHQNMFERSEMALNAYRKIKKENRSVYKQIRKFKEVYVAWKLKVKKTKKTGKKLTREDFNHFIEEKSAQKDLSLGFHAFCKGSPLGIFLGIFGVNFCSGFGDDIEYSISSYQVGLGAFIDILSVGEIDLDVYCLIGNDVKHNYNVGVDGRIGFIARYGVGFYVGMNGACIEYDSGFDAAFGASISASLLEIKQQPKT